MVRRRRRQQGQQRRPDQEVREALRLVGQREGPQPPPRPEQGLRAGDRRDLLLRQQRRHAPPRRARTTSPRSSPSPGTDWVVGWATYFDDNGDEWDYPRKKTERGRSTGSCTTPSRRSPASGGPRRSRRSARSRRSTSGASTTSTGCACTSSAGYRPKVVRRCLGEFRLQPQQQDGVQAGELRPGLQGHPRGIQQVPHAREQIRHWHRERKKEQGDDKVMKAWQALKWEGAEGRPSQGARSRQAPVHRLDAWRVMYCAPCADGEPTPWALSPTVSVVVPVYNTERYVADTIDSHPQADVHRLRADRHRRRLQGPLPRDPARAGREGFAHPS